MRSTPAWGDECPDWEPDTGMFVESDAGDRPGLSVPTGWHPQAKPKSGPVPKTVAIIDGFTVRRCNRILSRRVVNDANVGPWEVREDIMPPTLEGLQKWVEHTPGWELDELQGRNGVFDRHLVDYGLRFQFWVPLGADLTPKGMAVVCVDATGLEHVTEGCVYEVVGRDGSLVTIEDDSGERREYFADRFEEEK